jgi:hypothetical protein
MTDVKGVLEIAHTLDPLHEFLKDLDPGWMGDHL